MTLSTQLHLSPAYERIKAEREQAKTLPHDSEYAAGLMAGLKRALTIMEEESADAPPMYLRRPGKPVFTMEMGDE